MGSRINISSPPGHKHPTDSARVKFAGRSGWGRLDWIRASRQTKDEENLVALLWPDVTTILVALHAGS